MGNKHFASLSLNTSSNLYNCMFLEKKHFFFNLTEILMIIILLNFEVLVGRKKNDFFFKGGIK